VLSREEGLLVLAKGLSIQASGEALNTGDIFLRRPEIAGPDR